MRYILSLVIVVFTAPVAVSEQLKTDANDAQSNIVKVRKLGRLFTTEPQRSSINTRKKAVKVVKTMRQNTQKIHADTLTVNGLVTTGKRQPTVWVNGHPTTSIGSNSEDANLDIVLGAGTNNQRVQLYVLDLKRTINLQPGQTYTRGQTRRLEAFENNVGSVPIEASSDTESEDH